MTTLVQRMPHLLLGLAALVLASWWVLARGGEEQAKRNPPAQQQSSNAGADVACDVCVGCDLSACDCDCGGCDVGGCDCVAVPPGATHGLEAAGGRDRPAGARSWASLGLLVPVVVMLLWRRRR